MNWAECLHSGLQKTWNFAFSFVIFEKIDFFSGPMQAPARAQNHSEKEESSSEEIGIRLYTNFLIQKKVVYNYIM